MGIAGKQFITQAFSTDILAKSLERTFASGSGDLPLTLNQRLQDGGRLDGELLGTPIAREGVGRRKPTIEFSGLNS